MQNSMGSKLPAIASLALSLALFAANPSVAGDIYKTVDVYGNVVYTDTPPKDAKGIQRLRRKTQSTDLEYVVKTKETLTASRQASVDRRSAVNKESTTAADLREQRNANCNKAQERLVNAEKARRVYEDTGDGERRYFSAEEQDEYKAKVKADVAEWCN